MRGTILLRATVSGLCLVQAGIALAQPASGAVAASITAQPGSEPSAPSGTTQPASAQPVAAPADTSQDGTIVVTARRRQESLQDVPISVAAISGAAIEQQNIESIERLTNAAPGVSVSPAAASRDSLAFAIRGQRSSETAILTDPPVGLYFAEVVQPRNYGFARALYDLQSVQVLRGVQGTLFGRNMTGGAVLVEPQRPTYDASAEIRVEAGNYNMRSIYGMINLPLADDRFAVRANIIRRTRDGFTIDNRTGRDYDNQDFTSGRFSVLIEPTNTVHIYTVFDGIWSRDNGTGTVLTRLRQVANPAINPGGVPFAGQDARLGPGGVAALAAAFAQQQALGIRRVVGSSYFGNFTGLGTKLPYPGDVPLNNIHNYGVTNQASVDLLPGLTLRNIAGYRNTRFYRNVDFFNVPFLLIDSETLDHVETYSEELQLRGHSRRLDWITGLFYFQEQGLGELGRTNQLSGALPNPTTSTTQRRVYGVAKSAAAFAAGTLQLGEQFKLSAGVRYNWDDRAVRSSNIRLATGACLHETFPNGPGVCLFTNSKSWNRITADGTLQWEPTDRTTIYASLRKGYRAGGFNARSAVRIAQVQPFNPEDVLEWEVGLHQQWYLGGLHGSTNLAVYDQNMTNAQVVQSLSVNGILTQVTTNVGSQHNIGLDFDTSIRTNMGLSFSFSYSYNNITHAVNRPVQSPFGSPKHQASFQAAYTRHLAGNSGELTLAGDVAYHGRNHLDDLDSRADQPAYALLNMNVAWNNIYGTGLGASLFVTNLTNKVYAITARSYDDSATNFGLTSTIFGEPRMYGASLSFRF